MAKAKESTVKVVKKLSQTTLGFDAKKVAAGLEKDKDSVKAFTVIGVATKTKTGSTAMGEYTAFLGDFQAVPHIGDDSGNQFTSNKLFMPNDVTEAIDAKLAGLDGKGSVEFAYEVHVQRDDSAARGYVYVSTSLIKATQSDALKSLADKVGL